MTLLKKLSHISIFAILFLTLSGCTAEEIPFVYRIDIPQGNIVTDEELARLEVGMTPQQVTFLLGTPLLVDTFHQNQWDYVYMFTPGSKKSREGEKAEEKLLRVYFEKGVVKKATFVERDLEEN